MTKKKIRVLINFSTLKSGGGQNVGLNFIYSLPTQDLEQFELYFLVAENTAIYEALIENKYNILFVTSKNPLKRIFQEVVFVSHLIKKNKIKVVYSYFGIGLFVGKVNQISGSADSNLYFPEINFWSHYQGLTRLKRWLVDRYRIFGLKYSRAVIYENSILETNSKTIYNLKETKYIKPSVNFDIKLFDYILPFEKSRDLKVGLFLCGWQLNKNIMMMPSIARGLKDKGENFKFIITAPVDDSIECSEFQKEMIRLGVENDIYIVGSIEKRFLSSLYTQIDFVFLLSLLESFSNNIIEAWYFEKPLIISSEKWAESICQDAAFYVNRDSCEDIVNKISKLIISEDLVIDTVRKGKDILSTYPTISQRTKEELEYIRYVSENY